MPGFDGLLDARTCAGRLGISLSLLRRLTAKGSLPHVRIQRRVLFRPQALERFVAELERQGPRPSRNPIESIASATAKDKRRCGPDARGSS